MPTRLYLDSARMGLVSERVRLAQQAFIRLAATEGCSLYFSEILEAGFRDGPLHARHRYPELADWRGITELKLAIKLLLGVDDGAEVLLANRATQLIRIALEFLCNASNSVLVTDTLWPSYRRVLDTAAGTHGMRIVECSIRQRVRDGESFGTIVDYLAEAYETSRCDSLFLPAISHDGIRLPVDTICRRLEAIRPLEFVVVDGAQAIGHVSNETGLAHADYWIAGTHKWLGGSLPMGIGLRSTKATSSPAESADDPLLKFTGGLETGNLDPFSETVSLACLFTCRAAIANVGVEPTDVSERLQVLVRNVAVVERLVPDCGWTVLPSLLPTGIVMIQPTSSRLSKTSPDALRRFMAGFSVSASAYDGEVVRLSMPFHPLTQGELDLLEWALRCWIDDYHETRMPRSVVRSAPACAIPTTFN